tara:strand:- start:1664 stop:2140 length:477 start_codon:yes stop_codon:yes gene_type:complete
MMSDIKVKHKGKEYILGSPEYYRSFIEEEKETPKILQDKMLSILIEDCWCETLGVKPYWSFKKNLMIEYFDRAFPNHKRSILNARLNELMKEGVIAKSIKYKTKPYLIKGRCWDSRVKQIGRTDSNPVVEVIMGDDPAMKRRLISDCLNNGYSGDLDI